MSEPIVRIAARGDGVTATGRHAARAAPGDLLHDDGRVEPGPHHQPPPCRHFPACGGCQLQHVDDDGYRTYLVDRVAGALAQSGVARPDIRAPHLSPPRSRRRASLKAQRMGKRVVLGFNEAGTHRIVDMRECHVLRPELFALVEPLRAFLAPHRAAAVSMTLADQGVDLLVSGITAEGLAAREALTAFAESHALARLSLDEGYGPETTWEPVSVTATLGNHGVPLPVAAFLQATSDGEHALVSGVNEALYKPATTADLFAGLGTFALNLPGKVLAVEADRAAILALKAVHRPGLFVDHRDLYRRPLTAAELSRFDAAVLDPPRAGAAEQVRALASADLARLAYVSCNPATFARDAAALVEGGWHLDWVRPVGQFRWSTHIELVAAFRR